MKNISKKKIIGPLIGMAVLCLLTGLITIRSHALETKRNKLPSIKIDPETAAQLSAGDCAGAINGLLKAFERRDSDPGIRYYLAICYGKLGRVAYKEHRFQDAIEMFETGLTFREEEPSLYVGLGLCYLMRSDYGEAEAAFKEVIALDPNHYLAHRKLGEIYYLTNELPLALVYWTKALALNNADDSLRRRLSNLRKQMEITSNLETEVDHLFSVSFNGERNPALRDTVMGILQDAYYEIGQELNAYPNRRIAVVLLTSEEFFDITGSPRWVGGLYEGQVKIPVANYNPRILKKVLYHEYVHAVIHDIMSNRCPWWLNEGLAQYFSAENEEKKRKREWASKLIAQGVPPNLRALPGKLDNNPVLVRRAYAFALSAVDFLIDTLNIYNLQTILEEMGGGKDFDKAIWEETGYTFEEFEEAWLSANKLG